MYTLVGTHLINNWDVSAERLSNVIHPLKIQKLNGNHKNTQLLLNLHMTFIRYFDHINDGPNITISFNFISAPHNFFPVFKSIADK